MKTLGFGQKVGQIVQTAYVVQEIRAAMAWWQKDGGCGPFFLLDSFTGPEQRYRGEPTMADVAIAMSFSGHMMIELVMPRDSHPSVYQETIKRQGYGFHHVGLAVENVEAARAAYEGRGYSVAFSTPVPSGGNVHYMGNAHDAPGFVELIPATEGMDALFTKYWNASVDWDGRNPVRPFG